MARRGIAKAESDVRQAHRDRLRYLSYNPEFLEDIEKLARLRDSLPGERGSPERLLALPSFVEGPLQEAGEKWQVHWDLLSVLSSLRDDGRDAERIALIDHGMT
jgi:hypothetical protein